MWLYRFLVSLAAPAVLAALIWRVVRGRESLGDLAERFGAGAGRAGPAGALWLHGASNGELTSARRLIDALRQGHPETAFVITCNTLSGRAMVQSWQLAKTTARLAPLDLRWVLARFVRAWQPRVLITLENELWPNRLTITRPKLPVIVVAARISARSAGRWARVPGLARRVMGQVAYLAPQDAGSGTRFASLGLDPRALGSVFAPKAGVTLSPPDPEALAALRPQFDPGHTWLAASTHAGEDQIVLDALRLGPSEARLILAPRHPRRGDAIRQMAQDRGLSVAQRSRSEAPGACRVYLADTLGEMALWYSLANVTLVGGSLVARGGHTPFEPAAFGSALVHGPHVDNFADIYARLDQAGAAFEVRDAATLRGVLDALAHPEAREKSADAARALTLKTGKDDDHADILRIMTTYL